MTSELIRLHTLLNSEEILPESAYRRNKVIFELVAYVNCLIGCVLSERRAALPVFIRRCKQFLDRHSPEGEFETYQMMVRTYIAELEQAFGPMASDIP